MRLTARSIVLLRVSIILVLLVPASALAQKFDLSPLLSNVPSVGDTRTYAISTGGQWVGVVTSVQFTGKAFRVVVASTETGLPVTSAETFIVPGKEQQLGSAISTPLSVLVAKPKRLERFVFKVGKPQRFRVKGVAFLGANPIGPATYRGESELQGFESFNTGVDFFPETIRVRRTLALGVTNLFTKDQVAAVTSQTSWSTLDLGPVAIQRRTVVYLNGFQQSDTGTQLLTLQSAVIGGVPYP